MTAMEVMVGLLTAILTVLGSWLVVRNENHNRALADSVWKGEISTKVNTMWGLLFRKSTFDALQDGLLTRQSPISVNIKSFEEHPELLLALRKFYDEEGGKRLSDLELLVTVEKKFSEQLAVFELKQNLKPGASLAAVCYLLRPTMSIFRDFLPDRRKNPR